MSVQLISFTEKNGFVTATKLGTTIKFLLLQPKILPQQPNVLLIEPNILLLKQNIFVIPTLTNDFVGVTKSFFRDCVSRSSVKLYLRARGKCANLGFFSKRLRQVQSLRLFQTSQTTISGLALKLI